jgi:hypothetical protein
LTGEDVDKELFIKAFAVYLAQSPEDPEKAAAEAKAATRIAFAKWTEEEPRETPRKEKKPA